MWEVGHIHCAMQLHITSAPLILLIGHIGAVRRRQAPDNWGCSHFVREESKEVLSLILIDQCFAFVSSVVNG